MWIHRLESEWNDSLMFVLLLKTLALAAVKTFPLLPALIIYEPFRTFDINRKFIADFIPPEDISFDTVDYSRRRRMATEVGN